MLMVLVLVLIGVMPVCVSEFKLKGHTVSAVRCTQLDFPGFRMR